MAGMWVNKTNDMEQPFAMAKVAIARAMHVNGCRLGTGYDDAPFQDFPVADNPNTCKEVVGCPALFPLVVCPVMGAAENSEYGLATPGFSKFIKLLSSAAVEAP
jgi:hypothetical protein